MHAMISKHLLSTKVVRQHIVFFTGAGVSAESGIPTFRDAGGLWRDFDPYTYCSASGLREKPKEVLDFYNWRRRNLFKAKPNLAHLAIARLERWHDVTVLTQNVDDLHEKAGSSKVIHLHGELTKVTSSRNRLDPACVQSYPLDKPINVGDMAVDGSQLRPFVVLFDEYVQWEEAERIARDADVFVIIGTSLSVSTSMSFPSFPRRDVPRYIIDPVDYRDKLPWGYIWINAKASEGMEILTDEVTNGFKMYERLWG